MKQKAVPLSVPISEDQTHLMDRIQVGYESLICVLEKIFGIFFIRQSFLGHLFVKIYPTDLVNH